MLPGVAYLELARAAAEAEGFGRTGVTVRNVVWTRPARITGPTTAGVALDEQDGGFAYRITTTTGGETQTHGQGRVEPTVAAPPPKVDIAALRAKCTRRTLDRAACYALYEGTEMGLGPAMRGIEQLEIGDGLIVARLRRPAAAGDGFTVNPAMLDSALQSTLGLALAEGADEVSAALPFALTEVRVHAATPMAGWAVIRPSANDRPGTVRRLDIDLCDETGEVCVRLLGFTFRELPAPEKQEPAPVDDQVTPAGPTAEAGELVLARPTWHPAAPVAGAPRFVRHEVLLAGLDPVDLTDLDATCTVLPDGPDLATAFTRRAEQLLTHLQDAVVASREGRVLLQVVVPAGVTRSRAGRAAADRPLRAPEAGHPARGRRADRARRPSSPGSRGRRRRRPRGGRTA